LPEVARTFSRNLYPVFKEPAAPRGELQTYTGALPLSTPTPTPEAPRPLSLLGGRRQTLPPARTGDYRERYGRCQPLSGSLPSGPGAHRQGAVGGGSLRMARWVPHLEPKTTRRPSTRHGSVNSRRRASG
jgi:hypothetical protein